MALAEIIILLKIWISRMALLNLTRTIPSGTSYFTGQKLYKTYNLSILLFSSEVWHPSITDLMILKTFQARATKLFSNGDSYKD